MPYQQELDDVRFEIRGGGTGVVRFWPKVDGITVEVEETPAATFTIYSPDGSAVQGATEVTATSVDGISRLEAPINAGTLELGEGYRLDWEWTYDGIRYQESQHFDVVIEPLGSIGASLNDLVSEQSDIASMLSRQAQLQRDGRTDEEQAQVLLHLATKDIRVMLKRKVAAEGAAWPMYIADREDLRSVVVAGALYRAMVAQGSPTEALRERAEFWRTERDRRFAELPPLRFSGDSDRVPESELKSFGLVRLHRRW